MNVTVNSQHLATELRLLHKVVPTKPAIAILSHVLLRADEQLSLSATDLEMSLSTTCAGRVDEPGAITLPAAKLLALVEQFPDADVSIKVEKDKTVVRCGAFTSRMQSQSADQFPRLPEPQGESCVLDAEAFRQLVAKTRYAINAANSKYTLRGALLTLAGPVAAMVATDARRLSLATVFRVDGPERRVILPSKVLDVLSGQTEVGDLELTVGEKHLFFSLGGRTFASRTIDGEFPKYERIIPVANDKVITADRQQLTAALRRVLVAVDRNGATYLDLKTDGQLHLSATSAEVGTGDETIGVEYDGTPIRVCVNGTYVLDFLDASSGQTVVIKLKDASSAALLQDGEDHVGVVMLMRG